MKHTIYNNYYSSEREEEARQFLFESRDDQSEWKTAADIPDETVFDELAFQNDIEWDEAKADLERFLQDGNWLISGTFGGWRGRQSAGAVISSFDELSKAWKDCDYINICDEDGHLYIECTHHDGTNHYELKRLTDKGYELVSGYNLRDQEAHEKAFSCNLFTALPHYAHKVYGCKKYA